MLVIVRVQAHCLKMTKEKLVGMLQECSLSCDGTQRDCAHKLYEAVMAASRKAGKPAAAQVCAASYLSQANFCVEQSNTLSFLHSLHRPGC